MALLGAIIKKLIEAKDHLPFTDDSNPIEEQDEVLENLLNKAKNTQFGKYYNFREILNAENKKKAFAEAVPYFSYDKMAAEWWDKVYEGESDVSWPGEPPYFALSSGTTGEKKRIPVSDEMLSAIRKAGLKQIGAMSNFNLESDFFEKEILMLGSSTDLKERDGHKEGEISGISASNIPFWFQHFYKPGVDIAKIDDWDKRVESIAENAKDWDIGVLSGIPSWMELMLKRVIEKNDVDNIHEIWPNLRMYASGGVAFEPYERSFNELLGRPIQIVDTYLASEGFLALQSRPETRSMQLLTDNGIYFEFVPFESENINSDGSIKQTAEALALDKVEEGKEYVLIVSTVSGLWRYSIGDTVKFTDVKRNEIRITGRTKFFLNVVGSQLSVLKMNRAIGVIEDEYDINIPEFTVAAVRENGNYIHKWYLGSRTPIDKSTEIALTLDEELKKTNKNYKVARNKALKDIKVELIPIEIFYRWNERRKKKGGQVKMEKVMDAEDFQEWETFVKKELE